MVSLPSLISTLSNQTIAFGLSMNTAGGIRPPAVMIYSDPVNLINYCKSASV